MLLDKENEGGFDRLPEEEKNFYGIYLLEHETYGGGLDVWFHQGHHNQLALALRKVGADKSAVIIDTNEAWFNSLDRFDLAYRENPDNLEPLLINYARKHDFWVE